jgi:peptidyl-tRNA hydrolase
VPMDEAELNALCEHNKLEIFAIYQKHEQIWNEMVRKWMEEGAPEPTLRDKYNLKLGECDLLIEQIKQQKRLLRWRNGEKIEPVAHEASVVCVGEAGMAG